MAHDNRTSIKNLRGYSRADIVEQFRTALVTAGIEFANGEHIIPDGTLHRIRLTQDKPGQRSGWYRLHLDPPPAGAAGDWRSGCQVQWCAKRPEYLTPADQVDLWQRVQRNRAEHEAEERSRHKAAAKRGVWVWIAVHPARRAKTIPQWHEKGRGLYPGSAKAGRKTVALDCRGLGHRLHPPSPTPELLRHCRARRREPRQRSHRGPETLAQAGHCSMPGL